MPKDVNSKQSGFYQGSDTNDPQVHVYKGKNQFPQSFQHPSTCMYGVVDPVGVARCERGDTFPYKFVTDLNTFTMASPMKSKVNMYSSAFKVPMKAIYPRNWDIMYPIPNKGDDVPESTRSLLNMKSFLTNMSENLLHLSSHIVYDGGIDVENLNLFVRNVFILESIFSDGSLFAKLNMHFCAAEFSNEQYSVYRFCFDDWFDNEFVPWLQDLLIVDLVNQNDVTIAELKISQNGQISFGLEYRLSPSYELVGSGSFISFERMLELLRSGEFVFSRVDFSIQSSHPLTLYTVNEFREDYNIEPVIAYQLACSHFFNNPKIDFVYSADLYRDNMESLLSIIDSVYGPGIYPAYFKWNSLLKMYDIFSSRILNDVSYSVFNNAIEDYSRSIIITSFWLNLFSFHNSLRYGDYFTGAHPNVLAPGDINSPVIDGTVNALDMTKKLQITRLLNKVNITGPRMQDYLRALFGGELPEAPDDIPIRLSLEQFTVSGFEVNNTGEAQLDPGTPNITTTNLRLDDSRYMFTAEIDQPCWLVFVQYFDAHRIYSKTMDRFSHHKTRYDDFIPDLQFVGDQDIKADELDATRARSRLPFGYNLRYMEYKQRYSYASGAFIRRLKSWAMITDNSDGNPADSNISPRYIRSSPSEFDRFYKSLGGFSLGTRYHFITFTTNVCAPWRQMVYAPEILA